MVLNQDIVAAARTNATPTTPWTQERKDAGAMVEVVRGVTRRDRDGSPSRVTNTRESGAASSEPAADESLAGVCPAPSRPTPGCGAPTSLPSSPKARSAAPPTLTRGDGRDVGGASSTSSVVASVGNALPAGSARTDVDPSGDRGGKARFGGWRIARRSASASVSVAADRLRGDRDAAPARRRGRTFCEGRR